MKTQFTKRELILKLHEEWYFYAAYFDSTEKEDVSDFAICCAKAMRACEHQLALLKGVSVDEVLEEMYFEFYDRCGECKRNSLSCECREE